jgi:hypothetical protein
MSHRKSYIKKIFVQNLIHFISFSKIKKDIKPRLSLKLVKKVIIHNKLFFVKRDNTD